MSQIQKGNLCISLSDDDKWEATVTRNRDFDGVFYYAVATTGVYCRPSCPARRANRANVAFYATPEDAEKEGFRACKRCKPKGPASEREQARKIAEACRIIETAQEVPKLKELAEVVGLSAYHFHRLFRSIVGVTPKAYANAHRQNLVRSGLQKKKSVTDTVYEAGFNSSGRFYAAAKDVIGMTPKVFQDGGTATKIYFAVGESSLGSILVAQSVVGVCAILLGDDPDELVQEFLDQFPNAALIGENKAFQDVVAKVVGFVECPQSDIDLPLDIQGTAFQHRVWQALRKIPIGSTISYADLAKVIGQPNAVRAVAGACAANKIAIAIPCHRVIRTDGSLSGYRWGVARKQALLMKELQQKVSK